MIKEIKMPSAGQTTDAAQIVSVLVKTGDQVKRGDVLVEAETDKAILPVESYAAGIVLEVLVAQGDDVSAGTPLVILGSEADKKTYVPGGASSVASAEAVASPVQGMSAPSQEGIDDDYRPIMKVEMAPSVLSDKVEKAEKAAWPAMPNAKMLARELSISLKDVTPANGVMITRRDVQAAGAEKSAEVAEYAVMPMSKVRQIIARRMLESVQTIPAWQCTVSIDMEGCIALREVYKAKMGVKLSYNDILAKAVAVTAKRYPLVNARMEGGEVRVYRHTNVGLAVGLEGALLVPVAKDVDTMGLMEISSAFSELVRKAREGRLAPEDMGCGSVSISNLGMYDVDQFTAIVNPPESCILALGSIAVQPVWDGSQFRPVHKMTVTGSFDHRIIDGAYGAQFLREVKTLMEAPGLMLG